MSTLPDDALAAWRDMAEPLLRRHLDRLVAQGVGDAHAIYEAALELRM